MSVPKTAPSADKLNLAQLANAAKVRPADVVFAVRYCGLDLELSAKKTAEAFTAADVARVREWFEDRHNRKSVCGW